MPLSVTAARSVCAEPFELACRYGRPVLHVDRTFHPVGQWAHQGFPAITAAAPESITRGLYFALTELTAAADALDDQVVTDLMAEVGVLGELLVRTQLDAELASIALELWGQLQHAAGAGDHQLVAVHAVTMRRLLPRPERRDRQDTPAYLSVGARLRLGDGPLPEVVDDDVPMPADPAAGFLIALAAVLLAGRAHVVEAGGSIRCPIGAAPARVGWLGAAPLGPKIGMLSMAEQVLVVDPYRCVQLVRAVSPETPDVSVLGRVLVQRWLMDSTLLVDELTVRREAAVSAIAAGYGEQGPAWVWSLPLSHWAPEQFRRSGPRPRLLAVPNIVD